MILNGNETKTLPIIIFEEMKGTVSIKGRSISEEAPSYFYSFFTYFEDCLKKNPMNMTADIDLEYFSTKTARLIMEFLFKLKANIDDKGFKTTVNWYYEEEDDDLLDAGHDYQSICKLHFNFIEKPMP